MAEITFTGFVEKWTKDDPQHPAWGMRVSEPHRKKDGDKWVTVARTTRTVKAAYGTEIDFTKFPVGSRVEISGKELTEVSDRNGQQYYNLVVKAEFVNVLDAAVAESLKPAAPAGIPTSWTPVADESAPF